MKKILLLSCVLLQFSSYAQSDSNWAIGFEFSTDRLSLSDDREGIDYLITQGNINGFAVEFDKNNYSIGLTTQYALSNNVRISSGVLYGNKDFTGTFNCATCDFAQFLPETIEQRFLTVPVSVDYTFLTGKLIPYVRGGFKNNIEVKNDLNQQSKGYFLEAFIGASLHYQFSSAWNLGIGYNYQTALSDLYKTDNFNLRTNSFIVQVNYSL